MTSSTSSGSGARTLFSWMVRLLVAGLTTLVLGYLGYLLIVLGPHIRGLSTADFMRGYEQILQPAERRGPALRTNLGGADRVYLLTTQQERIVPLRLGRVTTVEARDLLHVDLWAFDPLTGQPAWKQRVRTFEDRGALTYAILGADATTLWLFVREPIALSLRDGAERGAGARIEEVNPAFAGKRVDEDGYVAFGAQGLQLTLSDSTQWAVDGETLVAQPRDVAPKVEERIAIPAYDGSYTGQFQLRGLQLETMWLGVLTDEEAATLQAPPVVPGAKPGERRPLMEDFLARQHMPGLLTAQPRPYRMWTAKVTRVSAAPPDWPASLPDNWGTRDAFSDYKPLPDAPVFLQAGLLGDGRSKYAYWTRDPDSVLVLHPDKVGGAGRLQLARVSGPSGHVVWDAALGLAALDSVMVGPATLALLGTEPNPMYDRESELSREQHEVLTFVAVASGAVTRYDLTAESTSDGEPRITRIEEDFTER